MTYKTLDFLPKLRITAPAYAHHRALLDVLIKSQPHLRINLHPLRAELERAGTLASDVVTGWKVNGNKPAGHVGEAGAAAGCMTLLTPDGMAIIGLPWVSRPAARAGGRRPERYASGRFV